MSPLPQTERIRWWIIGPAIALWLVAVIALSAFASPASGTDVATEGATWAPSGRLVEPAAPSDAPLLTAVVALVGGAAVIRPARRVLARRRHR